jgi:transposase
MNKSKVKYKKYFLATRLDIVKLVLEGGMSRQEVARQTGIPLKLVRLWSDLFSLYGESGLSLRNGFYSPDMKLAVLNDMQENGLSLTCAGLKHRITPSLIRQWRCRYAEYGSSGLINKPRGRPPKNAMSKKSSPKTPQTREQELEEENAYLRAENAYLKKLRALVEERVAREREIGREPSKH